MNHERNSSQAEISPRKQLEFVQEEKRFEIHKNLAEIYPELPHYLADQRLWKNCLRKSQRGATPALLLDFQKETAFAFNPYSWQEKREFSLQDSPPEKPNGILLLCAFWGEKEKESLESASLFLNADSPVFIFEKLPHKNELSRKKLSDEIQKRRLTLQNLGLAEIKILTRPSQNKNDQINSFLVWRARMPKEWHPGKPVNLLDEGPYWRRDWIEKLLAQNRKLYEGNGYQITNDKTIKNALRKTTFPLNTLSQTRLGFGYELEAPCGCRWQVGLNGDWTRTYQCEADCEG